MNSTTPETVKRLANTKTCPRCDLDKTFGAAICSRCRNLLPAHMRKDLEEIERQESTSVLRALRAAANYFDLHFQSVRNFGGGRKRH